MGKWLEHCFSMDRFEEEFYARFTCDPECLTEEKIKSSRCREGLMTEWILKFAKMYTESKCFISVAATQIEELNSNLLKGQAKGGPHQDQR